MDINRLIIERLISDVDFSKHRKQFEAMIEAYLSSEEFADSLSAAFSDSGFTYEVAEALSAKVLGAVKKAKVTVTI